MGIKTKARAIIQPLKNIRFPLRFFIV